MAIIKNHFLLLFVFSVWELNSHLAINAIINPIDTTKVLYVPQVTEIFFYAVSFKGNTFPYILLLFLWLPDMGPRQWICSDFEHEME